MFYTAVTHVPGVYDQHQRIGLALSTDLDHWTRFDEPVLGCGDAPWTFCDSTRAIGGEFRDPFVMPDPALPGGWLLYHVGRSGTDHDQFIAGVARSGGDLWSWSGFAPLENTHRTTTGSYVIESPDLIEHGGLWYLFYTSWNANPICFQTSADPLGPPAAWSAQRTLHAEVPLEFTNPWFGPEHVSAGGEDFFAAVNSADFSIEFRRIVWTPTGFTFGEPEPAPPPAPPPPPPPLTPATWGISLAGHEPGWERLSIEVQSPQRAEIRLQVLDAVGRRVRTLKHGLVPAGEARFEWNGTDDFGRPVASGLYVLVLTTREARLTRRIVRIL
jgi:hypothetical protein